MYSFVRLLLFCSLITACGTKTISKPIAPTVINNKHWEHTIFEITVTKGETWRSVAELTNVYTPILKRYNNLDAVKKSSKIFIPARKIHSVKNGESTLGIATKYGMTFSEFIKLNNLQPPYILKQNQEVRIIEVITPLKKSPPKPIKQQKIKFYWPIKGKVIDKFGIQKNGSQNNGIKISGRLHSPVKSTAAGTVVYVGNAISSYGNLIIIQHSNEWLSSYGNLGKIYVEKGNKVKTGKVIAKTDNTQLYFGLRKGNSIVNPLKYLIRK